jgi:hypothetical protein
MIIMQSLKIIMEHSQRPYFALKISRTCEKISLKFTDNLGMHLQKGLPTLT